MNSCLRFIARARCTLSAGNRWPKALPVLRLWIGAGCLCGVGAVAAASTAEEHQSLSSIMAVAEAHVRDGHADDDGLTVEVRTPDSRLRLANCDVPLQAAKAPGSADLGRVSIVVRCESDKPWRIHVMAQVSLQSEVWVLSRDVKRDQLLTRDLLVKKSMTLGHGLSPHRRVGSLIDQPDARLGEVFTRAVSAGEPLGDRLLKPRELVGRNAQVRIRRTGTGLAVEASGVALDSGALGDRIRVRSLSSGRTIEALVADQDLVQISR